jgi:hypothetical protein
MRTVISFSIDSLSVPGSRIILVEEAADYINGEVLTIDGGEWLNKGALILPKVDQL